MSTYTTSLPDETLLSYNRDDFWVFAYGSLMWKPDFDFITKKRATLQGYHRALCIYSWVHRGTQEKPGLVFGLDEGGACDGFAYKLKADHIMEVVNYLRGRELVTNVYQETLADIKLHGDENRTVTALTYTAVTGHEQYCGTLNHEETIRLIRQGVGQSGINAEYVLSTYAHMQEERIKDDTLARLCTELAKV